ncbi:hypothetical protein BASA60_006017 [Batrachochytrium salamandrivorans]|nr:hypothetical protein BASA60_006017 [Batrachochytrium salamandrivorans]
MVKFNRLPSEDFINFQFKSHANPDIIYTVNVPYVSGRNEECWNLGSKLYKSLPSRTLPGTPETGLPVSAEQSGHNHNQSPQTWVLSGSIVSSRRCWYYEPGCSKSSYDIRSLLANELKDTKSVMYDLRGNSGGDVDFADNMVQLFKPDFEPFGNRYLMNKITQNIFFDGEDPNDRSIC